MRDLSSGPKGQQFTQPGPPGRERCKRKRFYSGKLTADWREENDDRIPEQPLLTTVNEFRRACWERDQRKRMKAKGTPPKNDKWKTDYEPPSFEPMDDSPDLPEGWDWIRLGLLGHDPLNTVQTGPFGAQLHNDEFTSEGVPVIAVGNLTGMGFRQDGLYFIGAEKAEQLSRYDVQAGDVLFARSGATLGKVCVAPAYVRNWRMTGHILRVRLNTDLILPGIVVFALHGDPSVRDQVNGNIRGITRPGFNTSLLESIAVPVAPLAEQKEIVLRVETLFAFADEVEARLKQAQTRVDRITQSLLAKAFRGELVPTEHALAEREGRTYETALELLDGIRAERDGEQPMRSKRSGSAVK